MSPPQHVVVAGLGMVGARFVEEVRRHDPAGQRLRLTVLAAEARPGYNRVLLPSLLSGAMTEDDFARSAGGSSALPALSLRKSATVTGVDPGDRMVAVRTAFNSTGLDSTVFDTTGAAAELISYDTLVLATGGRPVLPPLGGLADQGHGERDGVISARSSIPLVADVAVLHSLADARRIATFAQSARRRGGRIAVLGGGVLGLETARALAARGTAVTLVHRGTVLMDRQLDAPAGRVLAAAMRRTGVTVELGTGAQRWESGRGLWLADGRLIPAAGLVLCTGTEPESTLAAAAGLRLTEAGAVAVDDALATSAAGIYAIGDCAGHPGAAGGLVQPGWEQAAVLAARLTGASPKARYRGSGAVTRLKAAGIELTCIGTSHAEPGDPDVEVLRFDDPARERYAKLVLADDRVAGAILIGLPDAAAAIVQLYDRDAAVPGDRLALLLGRALPPEGGSGSGPASLPDHAVVCRCNMVTKGQLRDAWYGGACTPPALSLATRAATGCGGCGDDLNAFCSWLAKTDPSQPDRAALDDPVPVTVVASDSETDPQLGAVR
jgi:assimilatory nitrate reductase electron transfer subunit